MLSLVNNNTRNNTSESVRSMQIVYALLWVLNNLEEAKVSVMIGQNAIDLQTRLEQINLMDGVLRNYYNSVQMPETTIHVRTNTSEFISNYHQSYVRNSDMPPKLLIWFLHNYNSYKKFEEYFENNCFGCRRSKLLFVYVEKTTINQRLSNLERIFARLFALQVIDVNVLMLDNEDTLQIYTYFPFKQTDCESLQAEIYMSFEQMKDIESSLKIFYPNKIENMYACPVKVALINFPPYIIFNTMANDSIPYNIEGSEGNILQVLADSLNFTLRLTDNIYNIGSVFENGTSNGTIKPLLNGEADITVGAHSHTLQAEKWLENVDLKEFRYIILVYYGGRKLSGFDRLIMPLSAEVWLVFGGSLLLMIVFVYLLKFLQQKVMIRFIFGNNNRMPCTNALAVIFGVAIDANVATRNFSRYYLACFLLYVLIIRTLYSSELFNILKNKAIFSNIRNFEELQQQRYRIYTRGPLLMVLHEIMPKNKLIFYSNLDYTDENLERDHKKIVTLPEDLYLWLHAKKSRNFQALNKPIFTVLACFHLRKHSYLLEKLKYLTNDLISSGITNRFKQRTLWSTALIDDDSGSDVGPLTFDALSGIFYLYLTLILLTIIIFGLELLSNRYAKLKPFIEYLNY